MNTAVRIKEIRLNNGLSQKEFGERISVKWNVIKDIENEKSKPSIEHILIISEIFSINFNWILTGEGVMLKGDLAEEDSNTVRIKLYTDFRLSAGDGIINYESEVEFLSFEESYFRKFIYTPSNNLHCAIVEGDSMLPTFLSGDIVLIDESDIELRDDKIYAINYFGENMLKRCVRYKSDFIFVGDNEDVERYKFRIYEEGVKVIGRAVVNLSVKKL